MRAIKTAIIWDGWMSDPIVLQWTPVGGPRKKLTLKQTETGWMQIESLWNGRRWEDQEAQLVSNPTIQSSGYDNRNPQPQTVSELVEDLGDIEQCRCADVAMFAQSRPIAISKKADQLLYHTEDQISGHPITEHSIQQLICREGLPRIVPLYEVPYGRDIRMEHYEL